VHKSLNWFGFGSFEVFRDIEAENFFLFDKHATAKDPLVKVFPSKKSLVLERPDRISGQKSLGFFD
jgi:hypothetical protein